MAHERITSNDIAGDVIVHWSDDGGIVDIAMMWDEPAGDSDTPTVTTVTTNFAPSSGTSNTNANSVVERRVEGGPGGMIGVPVAAYDAANPGGPSELPPLRAWLDKDGRWSIYMAFDRPKLNGLIRTLRRARNKAFGADE